MEKPSVKKWIVGFVPFGLWITLLLSPFAPSALATGQAAISLDQVARELQTPEQLEQFMKKNLRFVSDRAQFGTEEYWQTPEEMLGRRRGDCEDFALLAQAILKRNGYQTFILSVYWNEDAHTVTLFVKEGIWGIFNLDKLELTHSTSLSELAAAVRDNWSYLGLMRVEGNSGIISRKFLNHKGPEPRLSLLFPAGPLPTAAGPSDAQA